VAIVFLVEDNDYVVGALAGLLETFADIELTGVARTAEVALAMLPEVQCDVALIDLALPGMNGIDLVAALQKTRPGLPCVILSAHREGAYVKQALSVGARGYITKENPLAIIEGIERVLAGEIYLSEDLRE